MLSEENRNKIIMTGLYTCAPKLELLPVYKRSDPFWCMNWTFKPHVSKDGDYYMLDTYWSGSGSLRINLTDENFNDFEFIFDFKEVEQFYVKSNADFERWLCYNEEDTWHVAIDSGGIVYAKYFIRKGAIPDKEKTINRLQADINSLEDQLKNKHNYLQRVINDEVDLRYVR